MTKLHVISGTQTSGAQDALAGRSLLYSKLGVTVTEMPEDEGLAFYNADMLQNNLVLRDEVLFGDDSIEHRISVKHFNEEDAGEWHLYRGDLLSNIQVYPIVRDVFEIYNGAPGLDVFLLLLNEISESNITAGIQSVKRNRDRLLLEIRSEIEEIKASATL